MLACEPTYIVADVNLGAGSEQQGCTPCVAVHGRKVQRSVALALPKQGRVGDGGGGGNNESQARNA